jgi:DNA-binding XRE family transcriptional regulator
MYRNIAAEQARLGYNNAQMASCLGVSRSTYEKRKRTGRFDAVQIKKMLALFDCTFEYLFAQEGEEGRKENAKRVLQVMP